MIAGFVQLPFSILLVKILAALYVAPQKASEPSGAKVTEEWKLAGKNPTPKGTGSEPGGVCPIQVLIDKAVGVGRRVGSGAGIGAGTTGATEQAVKPTSKNANIAVFIYLLLIFK